MKILRIEIEHIRGVKNKIPLHFGGQSAVIFGPNGTGKSGIVDAIDFLFTGNMSRLTGRGSRGMSLDQHGPHIDADPADAIIRADILFDGNTEPVSIERLMSDPSTLVIPDDLDDSCKEALNIAAKGQHVLSRSEILKFIEAESGQRAKEIQALLNLTKVETIRAAFVTISREAGKKFQADKATFETSKAKVKDVLGLDDFSESNVLYKVNEHRRTLNGVEIDSLNIKKLKEGISPRTQDEKERVYPEQLKNTLEAIKEFLESKGSNVFEKEKQLRSRVKELRDDLKLKRDLQNKRLLDLGISLIDEAGSCPLCLTAFEPDQLSSLLKSRLDAAQKASKIEKEISLRASQINTEVSVLKGHIELLEASAQKLGANAVAKELDAWAARLTDWSSALNQATEDYTADAPSDNVKLFFSYNQWENDYKNLIEVANGLEKSSPEQEAWDALTALVPVLERYFEDKNRHQKSEEFAGIAKALSDTYTGTKDQILEGLYNSVNADFTEYYKYLHEDDEADFDSELKPDGANLSFTVDFYGRGKHHPRALHSEGHQDSMGLCLFLALNKKISESKVGFVILDDVVMSIDNNHRRNVCKLLNDKFPDTQFIITTHNTTWARQLKSDGVVKEKNMVRFAGWSVDSGPKMKNEFGTWAEIDKKMADEDISAAAAMLREHLEFFFEGASDSLKAKVPYKSDGRYELGDFISGCKERIISLIKKAKKSACSWSKEEAIKDFEVLETQIKETISRSQIEQWGINAAVHYNSWQDFSKTDFLPIVEAFKDFEGLFNCSTCGGLLSLGMQGVNSVSLKCPCGDINWNLEEKNRI